MNVNTDDIVIVHFQIRAKRFYGFLFCLFAICCYATPVKCITIFMMNIKSVFCFCLLFVGNLHSSRPMHVRYFYSAFGSICHYQFYFPIHYAWDNLHINCWNKKQFNMRLTAAENLLIKLNRRLGQWVLWPLILRYLASSLSQTFTHGIHNKSIRNRIYIAIFFFSFLACFDDSIYDLRWQTIYSPIWFNLSMCKTWKTRTKEHTHCCSFSRCSQS